MCRALGLGLASLDVNNRLVKRRVSDLLSAPVMMAINLSLSATDLITVQHAIVAAFTLVSICLDIQGEATVTLIDLVRRATLRCQRHDAFHVDALGALCDAFIAGRLTLSKDTRVTSMFVHLVQYVPFVTMLLDALVIADRGIAVRLIYGVVLWAEERCCSTELPSLPTGLITSDHLTSIFPVAVSTGGMPNILAAFFEWDGSDMACRGLVCGTAVRFVQLSSSRRT